MKLGVYVAIVAILFAFESANAAMTKAECQNISKQLRAMNLAQKSILKSMTSKNESMASTLDQFADELSASGKRVTKSDILVLKKSADSFRGHKVREEKLISKFEQSSEELIRKTVLCLSQNKTEGKLRQSKESSIQ